MSVKMGRPFSENPRNHKLFIRLTNEENERLEECCSKTAKSKAEIVRYGLQLATDKILEKD